MGEITVAAMASNSWEVIKPVVSWEPTMLTSTRTSEPACKVAPGVVPTALRLKIFSTGGEALAFDGDFFARGEDGGRFDTQGLGGESLQLLTEDDGVRTTGADKFHLRIGEGAGDVDQFFAISAVEFFLFDVDGQFGAGGHGVDFFEHGLAIGIDDDVAVGVGLLHPVFEVDADAAGHANGGEEDGGDAIGASHDGGDVDERHVFAGLLTNPQGNVVDARHAGGAHTHGALFGDEHDALARVFFLHFHQVGLVFGGHHALAVQFAVRAAVRFGTWGEQVGGDITHTGDVGDNVDGFFDGWQLGEELSLGVAFNDVFGDGVAGLEGSFETLGVGIIEEDLGF